MIHKAVLTKEVLELLDPGRNENFIDCTIGEGGHTASILEKNGPEGKVLGIDLDPQQISSSKWLESAFKDRIILVNDSYANLQEIVAKNNFGPVNGILLDLGMSSWQLEGTEKGFSFKLDQALDMRYNDRTNSLTAEIILNEWPEDKIKEILKEYGEEKFADEIAKNIIEERKRGRIKSTFQLVEVIKKAIPSRLQYGRIHCATKTFQALRIAVNGELENLKNVLPQAVSVLSSRHERGSLEGAARHERGSLEGAARHERGSLEGAAGGRIAVISFHSLEDRIVKNFFREKAKENIIKILTKKPVMAKDGELSQNPRSRSAKLRAFIKN